MKWWLINTSALVAAVVALLLAVAWADSYRATIRATHRVGYRPHSADSSIRCPVHVSIESDRGRVVVARYFVMPFS